MNDCEILQFSQGATQVKQKPTEHELMRATAIGHFLAEMDRRLEQLPDECFKDGRIVFPFQVIQGGKNEKL